MSKDQELMPKEKRIISRDNKFIIFLIGLPFLAWLPGAGLPGNGWGTVAVFSAFMLTFWAFVMR